MRKSKLTAVLAALSIGVTSAAGAVTLAPEGALPSPLAEAKGMIHEAGMVATTAMEQFETRHLALRHARYSSAADAEFFAGPKVLISRQDGNSLGMLLACIGLMGVIVVRRRSM